ncbi:MAG: hypothetical protein KJ850_01015 [Gammaproteobacteria bacterium]|nr:hypothetical protein [Gammaproteobacteria bacterium]MBU1623603.1 hypothetical protein [Gammaproteobacteria bacterium]
MENPQKPEIEVFSFKFLSRIRFGFLITIPSIVIMVIPAFILDMTASLYQAVNFRAYEIPLVGRKKYIFLDRYALRHLNFMEKFFCVYCGYFNGVMQYVSEIAARTEEFWCPIKHSKRVGFEHKRYMNYLEYDDSTEYHAKRKNIRLTMRRELQSKMDSENDTR